MSKCTFKDCHVVDPLYRNNDQGVDAVWRCREHLDEDRQPDPTVEFLCNVIGGYEIEGGRDE